MQAVVRTVNFVRTRGLNHRQLTVFSVVRRFLIYVGKLKTLCANNHFQISLELFALKLRKQPEVVSTYNKGVIQRLHWSGPLEVKFA